MKDGELERIKGQVEEKQDELNRVNSLLGEEKGKYSSLQERFNMSQSENDRLKNELEKVRADLLKAIEDNKKLENSLWEQNQQIDNQLNELREVQENHTTVIGKVEKFEKALIPELKAGNEQTKKELGYKTQEVDELSKKLDS